MRQSDPLFQLISVLEKKYPSLAVIKSCTYDTGTPFLDIWKPVSNTSLCQGLRFLPCFHVIATTQQSADGKASFNFAFVSFHGIVICETVLGTDVAFEANSSVDILDSLSNDKWVYCRGVLNGINGNCTGKRMSISKLSNLLTIEPFDGEVRVRSRFCSIAVQRSLNDSKGQFTSCDECLKLNNLKEFKLDTYIHQKPYNERTKTEEKSDIKDNANQFKNEDKASLDSSDIKLEVRDESTNLELLNDNQKTVKKKKKAWIPPELSPYPGLSIKLNKTVEYDVLEESETGLQLIPHDQDTYSYPDQTPLTTKLLFRCKLCLKTYSAREYVVKCMQRHVEEIDVNESVICPVCKQFIQRKLDLTDHFSAKHGNQTCCCVCLKILFNADNVLRKHILTKHHKGGKQLVCSWCGNSFNRAQGLRNHIASMHEKTDAYVCSICGKSSATKHSHRSHLASHSTENLKCLHCDKKFNRRERIREHLCRHTKIRPYKCAHCHYTTNKRYNVFVHVEKNHSKKHEKADVSVLEDLEREMYAHVKEELKLVMAASNEK